MTTKPGNATTKSAFIAVIGLPNVGKSTLVNRLIGRKVSIVSDKPQTTRNRIMGVKTDGAVQLVFLDTPGAHRPKNRLGEFMVKSIRDAVSGVDAAVLVTQTIGAPTDEERSLLRQCGAQGLPVVLAINKIDKLPQKSVLLEAIDRWREEHGFSAIVPISALSGEGVDILYDELIKFAVESPHFFPDDIVSDQQERFIASELIREKILYFLRDEVPHGVAVVVEKMGERKSGEKTILDVETIIYCERESHKGIIIGKNGAMLKEIGQAARLEMEEFFNTKVNLQCWVKVKEDWRNRQGLLHSFGYK